jgi:hypothetical protein
LKSELSVAIDREANMEISAETVRYIKLGKGGNWADTSINRSEVHFGYKKTTHELASAGNFETIKAHLIGLGQDAQAASREAREVLDFYELGADCLWITFARDHLWWTFANPEVTWIGGDGKLSGERFRKAIDGWCNTDVNGVPLRTNTLSTRLTKVGNYRRTICKVEAEEYLLRRINGLQEPFAEKSTSAQEALIDVLVEGLGHLHQTDFETLVDMMFARSGWHRVSAVGGSQKLVDLELEQPTTGERAAVQVKSTAGQKTLDQYIVRLDDAERFDRFFFICHSPEELIVSPSDRPDVHVWTGRELASTVLRLGLQDWVFEKAAVL